MIRGIKIIRDVILPIEYIVSELTAIMLSIIYITFQLNLYDFLTFFEYKKYVNPNKSNIIIDNGSKNPFANSLNPNMPKR
jgi:hypothetical protein